jgi:hypothetical protein
MQTNLTEELLEKIKAVEKHDGRFKILRTEPLIRTTKQAASLKQGKQRLIPNPLTIKRNLKLDTSVLLVIFVAISSPFIYFLVTGKSENAAGIAFALLFILVIFSVCLGNLTQKELVLPIVLSDKQIEINEEIHTWDSIENTFIVYGSGASYRFVIGFKSGDLNYFDIANQPGLKYNERDFSAFVEYFRESANDTGIANNEAEHGNFSNGQ